MKKFNEITKTILTESDNLQKESERLYLLEDLSAEETSDILDVLLEYNLFAQIISENFSEEDVESIVSEIPLDKEELQDFKITKNDREIVINWKKGKVIVSVDDVETFVPGKVMDPEALVGAVRAILQDYVVENVLKEEITSDDVFDVLSKIPSNTKELVGKTFDVRGDELTIDWNSESGETSASLNGKSLDINDKVYDLESLIDVVSTKAANTSDTEKTSEKEEDDEVIKDPVIKKKVAIFKSLIRPRMLDIFVTDNTDRTRVREALLDYIKNGTDESKIKDELTQRSLIGLLLKVIDMMASNRDLTSLFVRNVTASAISESILLESKKKSRKKKKKTEETVDEKLDMLLKLGLVDTSIYNRAKRALNNKKTAGTVPYLRNILFDLLDKLVSYIKKDSTIYNRIRLNVMKEMKGTLPSKKDLDLVKEAGKLSCESGEERIVPETYKKNFFTNQAWLAGYDSTQPKEKEEGSDMIKESDSTISNLDFWGWISPTGKVLVPSKADAETYTSGIPNRMTKDVMDKFTFDGVLSGTGISDTNAAMNKGWIRWGINNGIFGAEFKLMLFTTSALEKGIKAIETLLQNPSNYNYFTGNNSKGEVSINSFSLTPVGSKKITGDNLEEVIAKLKTDLTDKFVSPKTEEGRTYEEFTESLNLSAVTTISDIVDGLEIISTNIYSSKEEALEEISSLLSSVGLVADSLDEGENKLQSDDGSEATIAVFAKESEDSEDIEGELTINLKFSESEEGVGVSAEIMVSFDENETISLSDIEFEVESEENDEEETPETEDNGEEMDSEFDEDDVEIKEEDDMKDETEYYDMDELEEEIAKLDEACNRYTKGEVISEELEAGKTFNVVLMRPTTRRYVSLIIQANNEKEIQNYVKEEMPEYVVVSIDPVHIEDLPSNKNDKSD